MPPADISSVPLVALSNATKDCISTLLNPPKCIPSDDGLPRDWRGLAHLSGLGGEAIPNISSKPDPCGYILNKMQEKGQGLTIGEFQTLLERLDRWDIVDDTLALMEKDAESYEERSKRTSESANVIENDIDEQILTYDDSYRLQLGLEKQYYDAFLLFADEDIDFADEISENLEKKFGLKLCRKDRDFVIGLPFEHTATMTLISERCNRLLVIVSSNFLRSSANKFFLNYAQALGIDKRQRKIIPCLYEKCQLPPELSYYFVLDYNRAGKLWDFWGRLRDSVKTPVVPAVASRVKTCPEAPPKVEGLNPCEKKLAAEEMEKNCYAKMAEARCEEKEQRCKPCEPRAKCAAENFEEAKTVNDKKYNKTCQRFKIKKFGGKKEYEEKCSMTELTTCESMPSLNQSTYDSTYSLSNTSRRKKNFVNKCVTKVRALMKS